MRRWISIVILGCLALHFAGTSGLLTLAYKNRHSVYQTLGIIAEAPMALCSGTSPLQDLPFLSALPETESADIPMVLQLIREVAFVPSIQLTELPQPAFTWVSHQTLPIEARYSPPTIELLRPPC